MKNILMVLAIMVTMLLIYITTVEKEDGIKMNVDKSHHHMTEYIRGMDA